MTEDHSPMAFKIETRVAMYHGNRTPADGEPDEVRDADPVWVDGSGSPITNPERIAELEKGLAHGTGERGP